MISVQRHRGNEHKCHRYPHTALSPGDYCTVSAQKVGLKNEMKTWCKGFTHDKMLNLLAHQRHFTIWYQDVENILKGNCVYSEIVSFVTGGNGCKENFSKYFFFSLNNNLLLCYYISINLCLNILSEPEPLHWHTDVLKLFERQFCATDLTRQLNIRTPKSRDPAKCHALVTSHKREKKGM